MATVNLIGSFLVIICIIVLVALALEYFGENDWRRKRNIAFILKVCGVAFIVAIVLCMM